MWLSVFFGFVAGWSCLWLSEQLQKVVLKKILQKEASGLASN
jgi:hypothetical protein